MFLLIKPEPAHNPFSLDVALRTEPLELEYLAAACKERNYEYEIYEAVLDDRVLEDIIRNLQPDHVLITGYITQEYLMIGYASRAKAVNPAIVTIIGGSHAQLNPEHFYHDSIDFICRADDVYIPIDLAKADRKDYPSMNGLCYREENGAWHQNELLPFFINNLPMPERKLANERMNFYRYLDVSPLALMKTSTSCPYHCKFCYGRLLNNAAYTVRDLDKVIEEIKSIESPNIQFTDDDFLFDTDRLRELIKRLREEHIEKTFICYGRVDFIVKNEDLLKELVSVGFKYFMIGLESMDKSQLDAFHKGTTAGMNEEAIKIMQRIGANPVGLFIINIDFKRKDFHDMRNYIKAMDLSYVGVSIFTPIPGSGLYEECKDKITTDNMEKWDFMHLVMKPTHMSRLGFYLQYYFLVMDMFRIANKKGIYRFIRLNDYKKVFRSLLFKNG